MDRSAIVMLKAVLRRLGLLDPARGVRRTAQRWTRAVYRTLGVVPHKPTESLRYWEERGEHYFQQVGAILSDRDPYFHAQREFLRELREMRWDSALEVGCGFGWHLHAIRRENPEKRIVGIDFSFSQLQRGIAYLSGDSIVLVRADARGLPFVDDQFDVVFTSGLLMNIHYTSLAVVLRELRRVARRSVLALEYAEEHMDSPERRLIMDGAAWHGHNYTSAFDQAGLRLVCAFPFKAFDAYRDRVPLSFFRGDKI